MSGAYDVHRRASTGSQRALRTSDGDPGDDPGDPGDEGPMAGTAISDQVHHNSERKLMISIDILCLMIISSTIYCNDYI